MKKFSGKILLFGEHSVLYGSDALAIPFGKYSGSLTFGGDSEDAVRSNAVLKQYFFFLKKEEKTSALLDLGRLEAELSQGLWFFSSIPQNYGVGSSGALVAALFDRFGREEQNLNITELKQRLSELESWFHGRSSGFDPLVSYLHSPVVLHNGIPSVLEPEQMERKDFQVFLVDSGQPASTRKHTSGFLELFINKTFETLFFGSYIPLVNRAVSSFLSGSADFEENLAAVSAFQCNYFSFLFPAEFIDLMKEGFGNRAFYLKLCGSGGGGFLLGFTRKMEETREWMDEKGVLIIESSHLI